ncbi:MAG: hypothetical protein AAB048_02370, partial [Planctomycetota bacterium]
FPLPSMPSIAISLPGMFFLLLNKLLHKTSKPLKFSGHPDPPQAKKGLVPYAEILPRLRRVRMTG